MSGYCITETVTSTNILHNSTRHKSFKSVSGKRWMKYASTCLSSHEVHLSPNVCSCYAVPTSVYPLLPFPDKPKYPQEWIFMISPPHSWSQVSVRVPFTRQIMGPQFIFLVKTAHTLGPHNTPQWRVYDRQFRWLQYSNERDWASCLNRWCSCLAFRTCPLNILSTTLLLLNELFCGFPQSLPTITEQYPPSADQHHFLSFLSISLQSFYFGCNAFQGTNSTVQ